jgi:hypothetical protein
MDRIQDSKPANQPEALTINDVYPQTAQHIPKTEGLLQPDDNKSKAAHPADKFLPNVGFSDSGSNGTWRTPDPITEAHAERSATRAHGFGPKDYVVGKPKDFGTVFRPNQAQSSAERYPPRSR